MKANELTYKILLSNGFNETENDVYECFLQVSEPLDTGDTEVYYDIGAGKPTGFSRGMKATLPSVVLFLSGL